LSRFKKILLKIISGQNDQNINFEEMVSFLKSINFDLRIKGSHYIFYMNGIEEIINIQPINSKCKAYQVKQIRNLIIKYKLGTYEDE
jgi:hypothetical protein